MSLDNSVTIPDVDSLRETEKALLVRVEGTECWVPKSVITDDSEIYRADQHGDLVVSLWFAEKVKWA